MVLFFRQTWTLTVKTLLVVFVRPLFTTVLRALILPICFVAFMSGNPQSILARTTYEIGEPTRVRSFADALDSVGVGRNRLVFVHNGLLGGPIEQVINEVADPARAGQNEVHILSDETEVRELCRTSLHGMSRCIAAAVFYSSPTEGPHETWNYTIRTDAVLGEGIDVDSSNNDQEIYLLPFQRSIDWAIARTNTSFDLNDLPGETLEYPYTSLNAEERGDQIRTRYMGAIIDVIAVAIFIGIVGITYQLTGLIAMERESGISQLIYCMMPNSSPSGGVPSCSLLRRASCFGYCLRTPAGITIVHHILTGLALSSFSLFGALFKRAQLSGISVVLACLLLGVVGQMVPASNNGPVIILGLLFPSMNYKPRRTTPWTLPGIVLWVLLVVQIIVYPILAAVVERVLYGTTSKSRQASNVDASIALSIRNFTKIYRPGWLYRKIGRWFGSNRQSVHAVNDLSMNVSQGQIMVLLGANGSGQSTTLDAIAGLSKLSSGEISINYGQKEPKFGLCPQKNVLWDNLIVKEHVWIFNRLKSTGRVNTEGQLLQLLNDCDLKEKIKARSKTPSGGQKRKIQLAMMFTGGSSVCCVDEISSGLDPISRRRIWDILLAERGYRTIVLTTHFLDEAGLLADHIAILSKGALKADGSSVELKNQLGSGYRIHILNIPGSEHATGPRFQDILKEVHFNETVYTVQGSAEAARFVSELEQEGITEYRVSGPTIEDVFLKVANELELESSRENVHESQRAEEDAGDNAEHRSLQLLTGHRISMVLQAWYLFRKRMTILRRNPLPYLAALLIPVIAAGLVTLFLNGVPKPGCSGEDSYRTPESTLVDQWDELMLVIDSYIDIAHYAIAIISPSGNLLRAMFTSLNLFSILCRGPAGREIASYPGEIGLYGGPIVYLIIQSIVLFALLIWVEGIAKEVARVSNTKDNLRLLHVNKTFKKFVAVEDITFGVGTGEVFALLGPNGAGKTTTISLIRGDIQPTHNSGEISVDNISVLKHRTTARSHLGVCPQFDAMDQMTVLEHLIFYARIRGVPDISHNVHQVLRAVDLTPFKRRMATKLSGGNKRKLSLGIALMGNPSVLLLDEPSSGMDAASKRVMWQTLAAVAPGRSIVLTTHSMEEADALAHRAGIMAEHMLALGTTDALRSKYGNMYHVHIVHAEAPHTNDEDMETIRDWVTGTFLGAVIEQKTYHGQLRFSVPADTSQDRDKCTTSDDKKISSTHVENETSDEIHPHTLQSGASTLLAGSGTGIDSEQVVGRSSIAKLFTLLEKNKALLGDEHYAVSQTTLDQVFLTIVGRHNIREENSG
ncbi:P-loop containing nucleoside triphosphate hydrolase protein [Aspergillus cavernicola]|uniref:P-loop containing nucleoside triphosphate hydrolase protein n=1 Tax=Aspergillus cavernicola TaxID=176166 RepID=A0ABR4I8H6_9EURO